MTNDIIFVAPDQAQKRRDYEEEIVRTIYLKNTILPQDMTEIVNGLRQLLDLRRVQQFNAQNAIIVRDTPDKVMLAEKIIEDIDKPKPEVVMQFAVLQARPQPHARLGHQSGHIGVRSHFAALHIDSRRLHQLDEHDHSTTTSTALPLNQLKGLSTARLQRHASRRDRQRAADRQHDPDHRRSADSHRGRAGRQAAHRLPRAGGHRQLPGRRRRGRHGQRRAA